ncbi:lipid-transfer protein [Streptomyces sp. NPDC051940]|uniref:lipid-transfer protein n=1 Tax=Streptomyces sp. NPDC051940 TaxID=3155675 RepID=UPI00344089F7
MRDIAIVAYARTPAGAGAEELSEVEMLMPVLHEVLHATGLKAGDIGFTCSGSSDYLAGRAFSFTMALDGVGAWPPISESHVEMDGAWALYEAWVKLLTGDADTALVYAYGKSSPGDIGAVLTRQLDPYYLAPLWPDADSLGALQTQAAIDAGHAGLSQPLSPSDRTPVGDAAAAVVLAAGDTARGLCARPAWIRGIDHRIEAHGLGVRDLADSPSTRLAATRAGAFDAPVDAAELHAPYRGQQAVLREALKLGDGVALNPSGAENAVMAAGLIRIGEAAARITRGDSQRALAHATSGPCLQQNLVAVLEGES